MRGCSWVNWLVCIKIKQAESGAQTWLRLLVIMFCLIQTTLLLLLSPHIQSEDDLTSLESAIPGVPGEDFPIFGEIPSTSFLCDDLLPGYYADPEVNVIMWLNENLLCQSDCQMFHICVNESQLTPPLTDYTFLCPNGTLFRKQVKVENSIFCSNPAKNLSIQNI